MQNAKLKQAGFGLLEVLVGLSILTISFFALLGVSRSIAAASRQTSREVQSDFLLEEGVEALRSIRDRGWTAEIAPLSGTSSLAFSATSSKWTTTATSEIIDTVFTRSFNVTDVYRDANKDITFSGGTLDPDTKRFKISVTWKGPVGTSTRSLSTYLTNYFND